MQDYNRRSIRIKGYDYSQAGAYFVTIVAHERKHIFGEISQNKVELNQTGNLVDQKWRKIADWFPNAKLDEYIVMPSHIHHVILLQSIEKNAHSQDISRLWPTVEKFGAPVPGSIPTIIRTFKSVTTQFYKKINRVERCSLWQRNYYEHIIRDEKDYSRICEYILANPAGWKLDEENLPL